MRNKVRPLERGCKTASAEGFQHLQHSVNKSRATGTTTVTFAIHIKLPVLSTWGRHWLIFMKEHYLTGSARTCVYGVPAAPSFRTTKEGKAVWWRTDFCRTKLKWLVHVKVGVIWGASQFHTCIRLKLIRLQADHLTESLYCSWKGWKFILTWSKKYKITVQKTY